MPDVKCDSGVERSTLPGFGEACQSDTVIRAVVDPAGWEIHYKRDEVALENGWTLGWLLQAVFF